jgi:hypothetical protein
MYKTFKINFHYISFSHISLGFHIDLSSPNIEIHIPSGFIRIGITYSESKKIFEFTSSKRLREKNNITLRRIGYELCDEKENELYEKMEKNYFAHRTATNGLEKLDL